MNQISIAIIITLTASKRVFLHWHVTRSDLPGIMFVKFFGEKYLPEYIMRISACTHCVQVKHLMRN